jgi:pimeloyl-ACP methyl ester carboxylesterase
MMQDKPPARFQESSVLRTSIAAAPNAPHKAPLLFVHGGSHTGACYVETPDGRSGWAPYAAAHGRDAYVVDWPGRGTSPAPANFTAMSMQSVADAVAATLAEIGPAVLVTHSMGAVIGWRAAEMARDNVAAIVAIAPGPPANLQPALDSTEIARIRDAEPERWAALGRPSMQPETGPVPVARETALAMWANSERFPHAAIEAYIGALVPESPRAMNERSNIDGGGLRIAGPESLAGIPIVVITGDQDPRHPRVADEKIVDYFGADFIWLADRGLTGHGHMMMIEHGHDVIADIFLDWLDARGL